MSASKSGVLMRALAVGTILQLLMVLSGHWVAAIATGFAAGGMAISLVAGGLYAWWARPGAGSAAVNGAIVGGGCGLVGILVSYFLGDVGAAVIAYGTASSAATGLIGGLVGRMLGGTPAEAAAPRAAAERARVPSASDPAPTQDPIATTDPDGSRDPFTAPDSINRPDSAPGAS